MYLVSLFFVCFQILELSALATIQRGLSQIWLQDGEEIRKFWNPATYMLATCSNLLSKVATLVHFFPKKKPFMPIGI
jgi:hypothetical protein